MTIRPLIPELQEIAKNELNETPEAIENGLKEINKFLDEHPYINSRRDDQFLIIFLRGSKYNLGQASEKIESYYKMRTQIPDFFKDRDTTDKRYKEVLKVGAMIPCPVTETLGGPRVFITRFTSFNPKIMRIEEIIKTVGIVAEIMQMEDDNFVVAGEVAIIDLKGAGFSHLLQLTPSFIKKVATMSQGGNPIRCLQIHFINAPRGFETIFNLYKSFLSKETDMPMKVHKTLKSLQQDVSKKVLPKEYGGDSDSVDQITQRWMAKIEEYVEYFKEESLRDYDEKLATEMKKK